MAEITQEEFRKLTMERISNGGDIEEKDDQGRTALHLAVQNYDRELMKWLVARDVDVNARGENNRTALHEAVKNGDVTNLDFLLSHGADVFARDDNGDTPLDIAIRKSWENMSPPEDDDPDFQPIIDEYGMNPYIFDPAVRAAEVRKGYRRIARTLMKQMIDLLNGRNDAEKYATLLPKAASIEDIDSLRWFLSQKIDINTRRENNRTALHEVAERNFQEVIRFLLSRGADARAKDSKGETPLDLAITWHNEGVAKILREHQERISNDGDIEIKDEQGRTALHIAVIRKDLKRIKLLLEKGADVNSTSKTGWHVIHAAAATGDMAIFRTLLRRGTDMFAVSNSNNTVMHAAAAGGNPEIIDSLNWKHDINAKTWKGFTPLHVAVSRGNKEAVECLLMKGADVNATSIKGENALSIAKKRLGREKNPSTFSMVDLLNKHIDNNVHSRGHDTQAVSQETPEVRTALQKVMDDTSELAHVDFTALVIKLVSNGENIEDRNKEGHTALHLAAKQKNQELMKWLVEHGADVNSGDKRGLTAFCFVRGNQELEEMLLAKGADINAIGSGGDTALTAALRNNDKQRVEWLVERGADVNAKARGGEPPIVSAASFCGIEMVKWLVDHGANINDKTDLGWSVLHSAANSVNKTKFDAIIALGGDIHAVGADNKTVLYAAASGGNPEIIEWLIGQGLDVNAANTLGDTPLLRAAHFAFDEAAECLLKHGADVNGANSRGENALAIAMQHLDREDPSSVRMVDLLRSFGGVTEDYSVLPSAAANASLDDVEWLIDSFGMDVDARGNNNRTALHEAVDLAFDKMISLLLFHGADVFARDDHGDTPLDLAIRKKSANIVKMLLKDKDDLFQGQDSAATARILCLAVTAGELDIIKLLLSLGVDINVKGENDRTALHEAMDWGGKKETADFLIAHGADVSARDSNGHTPQDLLDKRTPEPGGDFIVEELD